MYWEVDYMDNIMITSGTGFEGYEIVDYGPYEFAQTILSSNFLKEIGSSIADIATDRSNIYQQKLDGAINDAIANFKEVFKDTGYNAAIGFNTNVVDYSNFTAVVASGTLVKIKEVYKSAFEKSNIVKKELYVNNYYNMVVPRAVKVILASEGNGTKISTWFSNYNTEDIKAIKADVEFTNIYGDVKKIVGIDFFFEKNNLSLLKSDFTECKLPEKEIKMIESVKLYIDRYVTSRGIYTCEDSIDISLSPIKLKALKQKKGLDAVTNYKSDGLVWTCNCGHVNEGGAEECVICGRRQDDMKKNITFDYEPMIEEMQSKEYVIEIKDVLMKYIKDIDTSLRMELLEIMESGLQYEKTRGNMKDTVIEKVENLFLGL
jgi:uncharacterized protein YbjQ (UPF0145 family)